MWERGSALFHIIIWGKEQPCALDEGGHSFLFPLRLCFQSLFIREMWAERCVFARLCAPRRCHTRLFAAHWAALIGLLRGGRLLLREREALLIYFPSNQIFSGTGDFPIANSICSPPQMPFFFLFWFGFFLSSVRELNRVWHKTARKYF